MKMIRNVCRLFFHIQIDSKCSSHLLKFRTYKSDISLDKLYTQSAKGPEVVKPYEKKVIEKPLEVFSGVIPLDELSITHCKSSGPGGQHVNKVNTKVEVRFNIDHASWIPDWIKPKLKEQQQNRVNKNGEIIVTSEKTRKNILNQADCLDKIRNMVFKASVIHKEPTEEEIELKKNREAIAQRKVLQEKRNRSMLKQARNAVL